ncbi:MAG: hypothetical protein AB7N99_01560 [Simkaniaceae bacterium]
MSDWEEVHKQLQVALRGEIVLRQEILGNLNQQEYVLLIGDVELKEELNTQNNKLVHSLKKLIQDRGYLTRRLFDILPSNTVGNTLDQILDPMQEIEAETLLLYQKVRALVEKIHQEHLRIKTLFEMIQKEGALDIHNPALHAEPLYGKGGKKLNLITIDYPEGNEPIRKAE